MPTKPPRMSPPLRLLVLGIAALAATPGFGQDSTCLPGGCRRSLAIQVPAGDEITVIDPHVSSDGKPTPIIYNGADGEQRVDIPPAVLVHNYYYSGDRDFRGPRLPGGPTIVVVSHPDTGERHYLDVQMLPGSPRIIYRRHSIDYEFGARRIHIQFGNPLLCLPSDVTCVSYKNGNPATLDGEAARARHGGHVKSWVQRTGVPHAAHHIVHSAHAAVDHTADAIHLVGERVVAPVVTIVNATPLSFLSEPHVEDRVARERDRALDQASRVARENDLTIPTNR